MTVPRWRDVLGDMRTQYGPKLCGSLARSSPAHDAARTAESIAYFILMRQHRKRGGEFDERTWTAPAIDDSCTSEGPRGESNADGTASEGAEAYDSEDSDGVTYNGNEFENIF